MTSGKPAPIILVPGFWLGAWAWDEVADILRNDGHDVTALTLPGLSSAGDDPTKVSLDDHVQAIADAVRAKGSRVVLAVHSGAGAPGYAASDRVAELIAAMIYVDTGPAKGALDPDWAAPTRPFPSLEDLSESENLDGLSQGQLQTFQERALPEPGAVIREAATLTNDARLDVPTIAICTSFSSDDYKDAIKQGYSFVAGFPELHDVTWIDLPTSHWPMWSRPADLARILGDVASQHGAD